MEAPLKAFLLFFLLPDWLKLNHLRSRMDCGFSATGVTNYAESLGAKDVKKTTFEAAEMILGP